MVQSEALLNFNIMGQCFANRFLWSAWGLSMPWSVLGRLESRVEDATSMDPAHGANTVVFPSAPRRRVRNGFGDGAAPDATDVVFHWLPACRHDP